MWSIEARLNEPGQDSEVDMKKKDFGAVGEAEAKADSGLGTTSHHALVGLGARGRNGACHTIYLSYLYSPD